MEFELNKPVTVLQKEYTALSFNEPTVKEYHEAQKKGGTFQLPEHMTAFQSSLMASSASVPIQVIEKLGVSDFKKAWKFVEGFLAEVETEVQKVV